MERGDGNVPLLYGPDVCFLIGVPVYLLSYQPVVCLSAIMPFINSIDVTLVGQFGDLYPLDFCQRPVGQVHIKKDIAGQ